MRPTPNTAHVTDDMCFPVSLSLGLVICVWLSLVFSVRSTTVRDERVSTPSVASSHCAIPFNVGYTRSISVSWRWSCQLNYVVITLLLMSVSLSEMNTNIYKVSRWRVSHVGLHYRENIKRNQQLACSEAVLVQVNVIRIRIHACRRKNRNRLRCPVLVVFDRAAMAIRRLR